MQSETRETWRRTKSMKMLMIHVKAVKETLCRREQGNCIKGRSVAPATFDNTETSNGKQSASLTRTIREKVFLSQVLSDCSIAATESTSFQALRNITLKHGRLFTHFLVLAALTGSLKARSGQIRPRQRDMILIRPLRIRISYFNRRKIVPLTFPIQDGRFRLKTKNHGDTLS